MLVELALQTLFFFAFLVLQLYVFSKFHFDFLRHGKDITVPPFIVISIAFLITALSGIVTYVFLSSGSHTILQYFYLLFFTVNWFVTICFLIHTQRLYHRFLLSAAGALFISISVLRFPTDFMQALYMVGSLLWVGPIIFKKFKIETIYFILFLLGFTILDIVNVYVINPGFSHGGASLDQHSILFSGYLTFGNFMVGMGDFVFGFTAISWVYIKRGAKAAVVAALFMSIPLFILRLLDPISDIPYTPLITIPAVAVFFLWYSRDTITH